MTLAGQQTIPTPHIFNVEKAKVICTSLET